MANLRKLIATDLIHGKLRQSDVEETSTDRIGALAFSDKLGSLLWRLRWANDASSFKPAVALLTKRVRRPHEDARFIRAICEIALEEWLDDNCRKCEGRGHTINLGVKHACTTCQSTGRRRHSDAERQRRLQIERSRYAKAESRFAEAHMKLASADTATARDVSHQLERGR